MFRLRGYFQQLSVAQYTDQILALELFWPFLLILAGVFRILEPLWVGTAILLNLLPWVIRWLVWGKLTRPSFVGGALILLGISGLVGVWVSYDPRLSLPLFLTLLGSVALFFAIINTYTSPWRVSRGLVLAATLIACYFVSQYGYFSYPLEVGRLADLGRITGSLLPNLVFFTPHPNVVAGFLVGPICSGFILARQADGSKRVVWSLAMVIIAYGVLISGSRGAWLGLAAGGVIWGLWLRPGRYWRLSVAGVGLTVSLAILVFAWLIQGGWSTPAVTSIMDTAASRLSLYRNSLYLWSDYPYTGIGLGDTFALVYSRYQMLLHVPFFTYSHNIFLSVGLGLGLLGLISLLWLLISFYSFVIRVEQAGLNQRCHFLFRSTWLGVTVILVHGLTDAPQFAGSGWTMPMLFGLLGVTIVSGRQVLLENQVKRFWALPQRIGPMVAGVLIVFIGVITTAFWRPLLSAWYTNMGALHQTQAELLPNLDGTAQTQETQLAIADFTSALKLNPEQPAANRRLGLIAFRQENYDIAIVYLEKSYQQEPYNQVTLKALGYAYMWTGRLDKAAELLQQMDDQAGLIHELGDWSDWLKNQGKIVLSNYTTKVVQELTDQ